MASVKWRQDWVSEKCKIAVALARGEVGGSYSEAAILLCAALSALAAEVWPGINIDRARFIELLVRFGATPTVPMTISLPLLIQDIELAPSSSQARPLRDAFLPPSATRLVTGLEVDHTEDAVLNICPDLTIKHVRKYSYACLLYEQVRSAYAHGYKPGVKADSWSQTASDGQLVSYINRLRAPGTSGTSRLIYFHIVGLAKLAVEIAIDIDTQRDSLPRPIPASWWINGAM